MNTNNGTISKRKAMIVQSKKSDKEPKGFNNEEIELLLINIGDMVSKMNRELNNFFKRYNRD